MDIGLVLTAFGGMMAGFYAIARIMLTQASKDRNSDRDERIKLSEAITSMAKNSEKVANATVKSANEAKTRNGHLGELVAQGNVMTAKILHRIEQDAEIAQSLQNAGGVLVKTKSSQKLGN